jgi:glutamyl-tRNA synthetase
MSSLQPVRVRFAPSPTGGLHIGGVRTALYNYLLARQTGGTMILRIEDTDQNRFVPGAEQYIIDALAWAGIEIDEGGTAGGPYSPYRQSERLALYREQAQRLIDSGHAYYAFDTEPEIEAMRERLKQQGSDNLTYNSQSRQTMRNSLTLSAAEVQAMLAAGVPHVVRLKVPETGEVRLTDLIRGEVVMQVAQIDDKVLIKSDGYPTYHLANVVDDYHMKITHVIRGEEWLPSAPLHVLLYQSLGWASAMPQFAHLPLLLKPDGNGKLSKRDAMRLGFPIFPLTWKDPHTSEETVGYREAGYLPEAVVNFLALLGWNPGTTQELFTMEQLVEAFSLERISKAGARFDIQKAQWFNQQYLRAKPVEELAAMLTQTAANENVNCPAEKARKIAAALRERITFPADLWAQGRLFFVAPQEYDVQIAAKKWTDEAVRVFSAVADSLRSRENISAAEAKALVEEIAAQQQVKAGSVLQALRLAVTGGSGGPDLMLTIEILGGPETAQRIANALQRIPVKAA